MIGKPSEQNLSWKSKLLGRFELGDFGCELIPKPRLGDLFDKVFNCSHDKRLQLCGPAVGHVPLV
jgi:hypothetical protein